MYDFLLTPENIGKHSLIKQIWLEEYDVEPEHCPSVFLDGLFYSLVDVLHKWFEEHSVVYYLRNADDPADTFIVFEKESDAVLFKLTWG